MKISFCTTCMGQLQHIEQALLKNIEDNLPKKDGDPSVEFVLVDYNSKDGLKEWVENNAALKPYLENGTLVYARYADATHFHHAHAKNIAHRLATGDVVCNLDADNFTGAGFARYLADKFADGKPAIVHPAYNEILKNLPDGYYGRIALRREDFLSLGGYSETLSKNGWGFEDADLAIRALANGLDPRPIFEKEFLQVITHSHAERVKNNASGMTPEAVAKVISGSKRAQFKPLFKIYTSPVQANKGGHFGEGTVFGIDDKAREMGAEKPSVRIHKRTIRAISPMLKDRKIKPPSDVIAT